MSFHEFHSSPLSPFLKDKKVTSMDSLGTRLVSQAYKSALFSAFYLVYSRRSTFFHVASLHQLRSVFEQAPMARLPLIQSRVKVLA